jgi:hypothetical protein
MQLKNQRKGKWERRNTLANKNNGTQGEPLPKHVETCVADDGWITFLN